MLSAGDFKKGQGLFETKESWDKVLALLPDYKREWRLWGRSVVIQVVRSHSLAVVVNRAEEEPECQVWRGWHVSAGPMEVAQGVSSQQLARQPCEC